VVGAIIGADIYVASALGAGLLGPFSLIAWLVAGLIATVIALCFSQSHHNLIAYWSCHQKVLFAKSASTKNSMLQKIVNLKYEKNRRADLVRI
jgi:hypothetical protein